MNEQMTSSLRQCIDQLELKIFQKLSSLNNATKATITVANVVDQRPKLTAN